MRLVGKHFLITSGECSERKVEKCLRRAISPAAEDFWPRQTSRDTKLDYLNEASLSLSSLALTDVHYDCVQYLQSTDIPNSKCCCPSKCL